MTKKEFSNFKKCFSCGEEIEFHCDKKHYMIFVGDIYIDYEIYLGDIEKDYIYEGHFSFRPTEFKSFDSMLEEFLNLPFVSGKSINQTVNDIEFIWNTAGI